MAIAFEMTAIYISVIPAEAGIQNMDNQDTLDSKSKWLLLLVNDTPKFSRAKLALRPIIEAGVAKLESKEKQRITRKGLLEMIPKVAELYLKNIRKNCNSQFDLYFTWYIGQVVNRLDRK